MINAPTTTQAFFEDLINFTLCARGIDPTPLLTAFRVQCEGYEQRTPNADFLAELAAAKQEQLEHIASEKRHAVNGMVPGPLVAVHIAETHARVIRLREAELRCPIYLDQN
jgi:hypothetical protein